MPYSDSEAVQLGQFVLAAYDLYAQNDPPAFTPPGGYTLLNKVYADDITDHDPKYLVFGFIAQSGGDVVVAIRGTEGIVEWLWDLDFALEPFPYATAGQTESGFTHFYTTLRVGPDPSKPRVLDALGSLTAKGTVKTLRIAAHSLGSAVVSMLALEAVAKNVFPNPTVYTFASPMVGDADFVQAYNANVKDSWRVVNQHDVVPKLPPASLGYAPVNTAKPIDSGSGTRHTVSCFHQLRTYLNTLDPSVPLDSDCQQ